jgi:hypothetical protein
MSNQYKELSEVLAEITKQDSTGQCLNLAGITQSDIDGINNKSLSESLQEAQIAYVVKFGVESNSIASYIKALNNKSFDTDPKVVEDKVEVAVDCLNSQTPTL